MSNYIQGLLSKLRSNVFQMEIEAYEPEEIKEVQECLDLASDEERKIKNTYGYILTDKNSQLETSIYSTSSLSTNFYNNNHNKIIFNLFNEPMEKVRKKFFIFSNLIGIFGLICVLITQIEYEILYYKTFYPCEKKNNKNINVNYKGTAIRYINLIFCLLMEISCFFYNYYLFKLKYENLIYYEKRFMESKFFIIFIFESLIILIHPFPKYEKCVVINTGNLKVNYNIQTFLYSLNFLKVFFIFRSILLRLNPFEKFSGMTEINPNKINEEGLIFTIKSLQKENPFFFQMMTQLSSIIFFGILLRMFERPVKINFKENDYDFFTNGFWNVILSMTTVGYGDFFPKTHFGRVIIIFSAFFGNLLTSMTILNLTEFTSFTNEESKSFLILNRIKIRKELNNTCEKILFLAFKVKQKCYEETIEERFSDSDYNKLTRLLKIEIDKKDFLKKQLSKDALNSPEEIIKATSLKIDTNLKMIKNSLKILEKMKAKLNVQLIQQTILFKQLEQINILYKVYIKTFIYYEFIVHQPKVVKYLKPFKYENEEINLKHSNVYNHSESIKNNNIKRMSIINIINKTNLIEKKKKKLDDGKYFYGNNSILKIDISSLQYEFFNFDFDFYSYLFKNDISSLYYNNIAHKIFHNSITSSINQFHRKKNIEIEHFLPKKDFIINQFNLIQINNNKKLQLILKKASFPTYKALKKFKMNSFTSSDIISIKDFIDDIKNNNEEKKIKTFKKSKSIVLNKSQKKIKNKKIKRSNSQNNFRNFKQLEMKFDFDKSDNFIIDNFKDDRNINFRKNNFLKLISPKRKERRINKNKINFVNDDNNISEITIKRDKIVSFN